MKRDMDLIRRLMLMIEESSTGTLESWNLKGIDPVAANYHLELLEDAGLVLAFYRTHPQQTRKRPVFRDNQGVTLKTPGLSWKGCEFLDKIRDDGVWRQVKTRVGKLSAFSIQIISAVATEIIKKQLGLG